MSDKTGIQWTDATWNPVRGCTKVSAGCDNCYAMVQAGRMDHPGYPGVPEGAYYGLTRKIGGRTQWNGEVRLVPHLLDQPSRWTRPRMIFVNSMSDLFHEGLGDYDIDRVFAGMAAAPQHVFQVLTKRPRRMLDYLTGQDDFANDAHPLERIRAAAVKLGLADFPGNDIHWPLPNVWLGVSAENQVTAEQRIPLLLRCPGVVHWLSAEPLLGPMQLRLPDFSDWGHGAGWIGQDDGSAARGPTLDWVVVGGESGPGARPCQVEWIEALVAQCAATSTPVFVKQLGAQPVVHAGVPGLAATRPLELQHRKGGNPREWERHLRVRQYPRALA